MCGIIGYIGSKNPVDILVNGLKSLEYRGYDSAGIALRNEEDVQVIKSVGKIKDLEEKLKEEHLITSNLGIAHTRWATHGKPSEENAHPHTVGKVTIVHNGIIENAEELRDKLQKEGLTFKSDTDTEVIAVLINKYYHNDPEEAISKTIKELKGSYALGIIFADKEELYAVRKDSPLIVGVGEHENFIASDIAAIIDYTNKYILLEEKEIAKIDKEKVVVSKNKHEVLKEIKETNLERDAKDKAGYEHYMLKEIMEEPVVLEKTLKPYLENLDLLPDLTEYEEIHIVACGSAMYAGMIGETLLEEYANTKVHIDLASEYRYKNIIYDRKTIVILISQSGETADTIAAMRKAKQHNVDTLAIVNVKTSTIARESDKQIFIEAGPEIAVASTKAYTTQLVLLILLAYYIAQNLNQDVHDDVIKQLQLIPQYVDNILKDEPVFAQYAHMLKDMHDAYFIGRNLDYASVLEGALKLKEVSYVHADAYVAGELKHGPIALIEDGSVVIAVATQPHIAQKTISNIQETIARGARVILLTTHHEEVKNVQNTYYLPDVEPTLQAILVAIPLQLIAYYTACLKGCDVDKPRNLAKSVTVE